MRNNAEQVQHGSMVDGITYNRWISMNDEAMRSVMKSQWSWEYIYRSSEDTNMVIDDDRV